MTANIVIVTAPDYNGPTADLMREVQKLATALIGEIPVSIGRADHHQIAAIDALVIISLPHRTINQDTRTELTSQFNQALNQLYPSLRISTLITSTHMDRPMVLQNLKTELAGNGSRI